MSGTATVGKVAGEATQTGKLTVEGTGGPGVEAASGKSVRSAAAEAPAPKAVEPKVGDDAGRRLCNCCFAAGTPILTEGGLTPIEQLKVGDLVQSRDPVSGETSLKPVTQLILTPSKPLYRLTLRGVDGVSSETDVTDNHPYWVDGKGWVDSARLEPGMKVPSFGKGLLTVEAVKELGRIEATYNFTVADFHTYFAGSASAFVHNCTCGPGAAKGAKTGEFSIVDWTGYPAGVPKPQGPFRLLEGAEYEAARNAANGANSAIRRKQGLVGKAVDVHETQPVKFGGSATEPANKVVLSRDVHRQQVTPWWNQLMKDLGGQ